MLGRSVSFGRAVAAGRDVGVTRRTVVKGAAWSLPVIAVATAMPLAAASTVPCEPVAFTITPNPEPPVDQTITLTAAAPNGDVYAVTISSVASATTAIGQSKPSAGTPYSSFNMTTAGSGWNGGSAATGSGDYVFNGFAPSAGAGAIVLNQRAAVSPEPTGTAPLGPDVQTLTFVFTRNGVPFDPVNLRMDIFDITSIATGSTAWRDRYWDAVGFSIAPGTKTYTGSAIGPAYVTGEGAGTIGDPYRRAAAYAPTTSGVISDRFVWPKAPSGLQMQYSNWTSDVTGSVVHGWHFISISGISFDATSCD